MSPTSRRRFGVSLSWLKEKILEKKCVDKTLKENAIDNNCVEITLKENTLDTKCLEKTLKENTSQNMCVERTLNENTLDNQCVEKMLNNKRSSYISKAMKKMGKQQHWNNRVQGAGAPLATWPTAF
ncbi:hypothetical protein N9L68_05550 [bacterium]|nr:hypothetical protein [bacterium]